jgi:lipopolysaccharide export system protein LptA
VAAFDADRAAVRTSSADRARSPGDAARPTRPRAAEAPGAVCRRRLRKLVDPLRGLFACAALAAFAAGGAAAQQAENGIDANFEYWEIDGATGRAVFTGAHISQGELSISAQRGWYREAPGEELIEWRLEDAVEIRGEAALITADAAEFVERNGILGRFELRGSPARFEDLSPGAAEQAFGEAERLVYDLAAGVVSLSGEARIVLGAYAYVGCGLIYDIGSKAARSDSSECDRPLQMIRITPSEDNAGRQTP